MASVTMRVQTDAALKAQFEAVLSELGLTLDAAINHYMREVVRDSALVPPSYLSTPETLEDDLRAAEEARRAGYQGHTLEEVLAEMDRIIAQADGGGA